MDKFGLNKEDFDSYEEYRKEYRRLYNKTDKCKASKKKYEQTEEGKLAKKKYQQSEKGKLALKKYKQSEKGRLVNKKYEQSKKGRLVSRLKEAKRRAVKLLRTPTWSEQELIRKFYMNVPKGYHVDHIIPLQGETVSGLHVRDNLQYLTASENCSKKNKF